jgi:hypothetical protein
MQRTREFKSRAILEAEILFLSKRIEKNKTILISPYTTFYSVIIFPAILYQLLLKFNFFKAIRDDLQEQHRQTFTQAVINRFVQTVPETRRPSRDELMMVAAKGRHTINEFEKMLVELPMKWPNPEHMVELLKLQGLTQTTLSNYKSILRSIPHKLSDLLTIKDEQHMLYRLS